MTVTIIRAIELSEAAISYFKESINRPPGSIEDIESISLAMAADLGAVYEVFVNGQSYAAVLISINRNTGGKPHLNLNLLGGKEVELWRDVFAKFIIQLTKDTNTQLLFISRKGWEKIFPELKVIGFMYTLK